MSTVLSPKQVARAIGVSESSLKRWCDRGLLASVRTAGGHRRLLLPDVLSFIKQQGFTLAEPQVIGLPASASTGGLSRNRARAQLTEALTEGNYELCRQILCDLLLADQSFATIFDDIVAESFRDVGHLWDCGTVEVYQERRACEMVTRATHEFRSFIPEPSQNAPLAIGGTPGGDPYSLPTLMAELVLREAGWNAESLGTNLPFVTLAASIKDRRPKLFWLSVSSIAEEARFLEEFNEFSREAMAAGVSVCVGGRALPESIRVGMVYSRYCERMSDLATFATDLQNDLSDRNPFSRS